MCLEKRNIHSTSKGGKWEMYYRWLSLSVIFELWTRLKYYFYNLQSGFLKKKKKNFFFFQNIHQIVVYAITPEWFYLKS